ncbi:MAG TPA: 30S ribosomal protein S6--L-glutamate ligase [Bdellovibrionales bacterium]|nr:MAG: hypothetical protein A2Z97_06400 [Bdellovibrionales bacterium GWB1_52_6]OFZ02501.1 MAG: hypothetical protein A2X97_07515 [Bdellovibrionales bacterium GWA1_52_35]OFZ40335.1 MAG: hypothetical protein A2070_11700 [Bdellovibrionales bacterium GWC1_52_8]HAR41826.1 30S ribosomal protein S6--L-glutamate ligase [Bdellovibrionales bacterium]HCM41346.1 30S ribosomal protein S6--L-glutamate ligase [Bdellovibrionales bacterium]
MRIAILSRNKSLHSIRRLREEARKLKVECLVINPLECQLVVDGNKHDILVGSVVLPRFDVILPRIGASITDYGLAVVKQFENQGVPVLNGSLAIAQSRDKMRSLQVLAKAGIRVPKTVLTRSTRGLKAAAARVGGTPVVMKVLEGTQGLGVMLLDSPIAMSSVFETLIGMEQDVIVQQFLSEKAGRDYRVFVVGKRVVAAMMRTAPEGDFRTNIHRGGEGHLVKLPKNYERMALRACRILGLEVAGVDVMESRRGPVIIEVNSSPGFEGIERATGLNIAGAVLRYVKRAGKR